MIRTLTGYLWDARSMDDGRTWSQPKPTPLVHPDAPPMLFHLSDGETLAAFHHNRHGIDGVMCEASFESGHFVGRGEIWVSLSKDKGHTWEEPRFVFANALANTFDTQFRNVQCSYMDMFVDEGVLHMFLPHRWERIVHLQLAEKDLGTLPTRTALSETS